MSNLNMPVKYCKDENDEEFSPVVYQESMFNDDGTRMDPVPRKMFAKAYDPTKTYPTENLFCIQDNKYYKFTGSGTTTGTFDPTKWTETDAAEEFTALNSTLTWKRAGQVTGQQTAITINDNNWSEVNITVVDNKNSINRTFVFDVVRGALNYGEYMLRDGYYSSPSAYMFCQVSLTYAQNSVSIYLDQLELVGTSDISSSIITVYYR